MTEVNVSANTTELTRAFNNLSAKKIAKATSDAINKTLLLGRTTGRQEVKRVYNIPNRYLKYVDVSRAKPSKLTGNIYARTIPLPLDAFNPVFNVIRQGQVVGRQTINRRGNVRSTVIRRTQAVGGVTVEIIKGHKKLIPYAFLLPGAKPRVFARGDYKTGGGYAFIRRNTREENSSGNDRVNNMLSVTVYGALINRRVVSNIQNKVSSSYERTLLNALNRQAMG